MAVGPINTVGRVPVQPSDPATESPIGKHAEKTEVDDKATALQKIIDKPRRMNDPRELLALQQELQKWTLTTETQSSPVRTMGDQLKGTVKNIR